MISIIKTYKLHKSDENDYSTADREQHTLKLRVVCEYSSDCAEGRSANSQILILIRDCIEQYEEKHGKIELGK